MRKPRTPRKPSAKLVFTGGKMLAIYSDTLATAMRGTGAMSVRRASHVEPSRDGKTWEADMSPVGGKVLRGFKLRSEALAAEVSYLERKVIK